MEKITHERIVDGKTGKWRVKTDALFFWFMVFAIMGMCIMFLMHGLTELTIMSYFLAA